MFWSERNRRKTRKERIRNPKMGWMLEEIEKCNLKSYGYIIRLSKARRKMCIELHLREREGVGGKKGGQGGKKGL